MESTSENLSAPKNKDATNCNKSKTSTKKNRRFS